jgi:cytochrome c2
MRERARTRFALACAGAALVLAVRPPAQDAPERAPGLAVTLAPAREGPADTRHARLPALYVPEGAAPTPFVPAGAFRATWRGYLRIDARDRYAFTFAGNGSLTLHIDGEPVELGQPRRLGKGEHPLVIEYHSPSAGAPEMRLEWSGSDFATEPIPPHLLSRDAGDAALAAGEQRRRGLEIIATRFCTRCHEPPQAYALQPDAMPELAQAAPLLLAAGARLRRPWIEAWILDPRAQRPDARMPRVFRGESAERDARDVAAWLASLGAPATPAPPGDATAGAARFAELGCIGCHTRPDATAADPARVALRHVAAKWQPAALAAYLRAPGEYDPGTRMPDFALSEREANDLARFLLAGAPPSGTADPSAGDAARGRDLFATRGCAHCHFAGESGRFRAPEWWELRDLERGCLAADDAARGGAPDFGLADDERLAVRAAARDPDALGRDRPGEYAARAFAAQRCGACHERDGEAARWTACAAEVEELLPRDDGNPASRARPSLTWAGEKLRSDWLARLLRGEVEEPTRPWLRARMPAFHADAKRMAAGLAAEHGYPPLTAPLPSADPERAAIGEKLIGSIGGFGCVLCHAVGPQPAQQVFEVRGTDFAHAAARLREEWFHRWMRDPLRIDPSSRMPRYVDDRGRTGCVGVLDGDARAQFAAVWQYLTSLRAGNK